MSNDSQNKQTTETVLRELVDWCREHTGPTMPNSPHDILVRACAVLKKLQPRKCFLQWCGSYVVLLGSESAKQLTTFNLKGRVPLIDRVEEWCKANGYTCVNVHDGKVWL